MKYKYKTMIPALILGVFFLVVLIAVLPYPTAARRLPFMLSLLGMTLSISLIIASFRENSKEKLSNQQGDRKIISPEVKKAFFWLFLILPILYLFGLQLGSGGYVCFYSRYHGGGWLSSVFLGIGVILFIHLIFVILLKALIPHGVIGELIIKML